MIAEERQPSRAYQGMRAAKSSEISSPARTSPGRRFEQRARDATAPVFGQGEDAADPAGGNRLAADPQGPRKDLHAGDQAPCIHRDPDVLVREGGIVLEVAAKEVAAPPAVGHLPVIEEIE